MININCGYISSNSDTNGFGRCLHKDGNKFWIFKARCKLFVDSNDTCDLQEKLAKPKEIAPPPPPVPGSRKVSSNPPRQTIGQINDMIIINNISEIRKRNNTNWMDILKLAITYAPKQTKKIMEDISDCDATINKLTKELANDI